MIISCNSFTFYTLQTCRGAFHENTRVFLQALAVTDSCGGLLGYGIDMRLTSYATFGRGHFCTFLPTLYYSLFIQTVAIVGLINMDRFFMIMKPLRYPVLATTQRAKYALAITLLLSVLFTIPLWPIRGFPASSTLEIVCQLSEIVSGTSFPSDNPLPLFIILAAPFVINLVIITVTNGGLMVISCKHVHVLRKSAKIMDSGVHGAARNGNRMKGVSTVLLITGCYYFSIGIWFFTYIYVYPRVQQRQYTAAFSIGGLVELSLRWSNSVIYIATNTTFRQHAIQTLKKMFTRRENPIEN